MYVYHGVAFVLYLTPIGRRLLNESQGKRLLFVNSLSTTACVLYFLLGRITQTGPSLLTDAETGLLFGVLSIASLVVPHHCGLPQLTVWISYFISTALCIAFFSILLQDQGKLDEAKALFEKALRGREKQLGPSHLDTLNTVVNLANLLKQQGELDEAKALYERALRGKEEQLGSSHPDTLSTVNNLANLLSDQGKVDEAKALNERALRGREEQLGPSHPDTLGTVNNLAILLKQQGKLDEAKALYV